MLLLLTLAALVYFREEMLACYGIKGVALWVISYVGGIFLIYHLWPPLLHAWFTLVSISFSLTTRHRYKKYYAPNPITRKKCESWRKRPANMLRIRHSMNPEPSISTFLNTFSTSIAAISAPYNFWSPT